MFKVYFVNLREFYRFVTYILKSCPYLGDILEARSPWIVLLCGGGVRRCQITKKGTISASSSATASQWPGEEERLDSLCIAKVPSYIKAPLIASDAGATSL